MRQFLYGIGLLVAAAVLIWIDQASRYKILMRHCNA